MPSTALKGMEVQVTGSNSGTWGDVLNDSVIAYLDEFLAGLLSLSLSSSNTVLTAAQARKACIRCTGTLLANVTISPDVGVLWYGFYYVENLTSGSFTVTLSNGAGSVAIPHSRRAIVFIDSTNGPRIFSIVGSASADPIPVGTVMLFYQTAAPTGWTIVSSLNDYAFRLVSSAGGTTAGSTAFSTVMSATRAVTGTSASTVLTEAQMPVHDHPIPTGTILRTAGVSVSSGGATGLLGITTGAVNTDNAGSGSGHTHGAGTYVVDLSVRYANIIMATKT